jgi:hypothetical protein
LPEIILAQLYASCQEQSCALSAQKDYLIDMAEEIVTIGFRGTEEYRKTLQQEALNRGLKVQKMLEEAVAHYVGQVPASEAIAAKADSGDSPFGKLTPEERRWLQALLDYLRDGTKPFKENILGIMAGALGVTPEEVSRKPKRKTG